MKPLAPPTTTVATLRIAMPPDLSGEMIGMTEMMQQYAMYGPRPRETRPHVTVKHGLPADAAASAVADAIAGFGPVAMILGAVGWRRVRVGGYGLPLFDVLYIEVASVDLVNLSWLISERFRCKPGEREIHGYTPQVRLAKVAVGQGPRLFGDTRFVGTRVTADVLLFRDAGGRETELSL